MSETKPAVPGFCAGGGGVPGTPAPTTSPTGFTSLLISAMASSDFSMAAPIAVPRPVVRASMAAGENLAVGRRRHGELGVAGEHDQPQPGARRQIGHEVPRRPLGGGDAVRVDVGRAHRAGHVEGEDDRRPRRRHVLHHLGAGRRHAEHAQAGEQRPQWKVAPPPRAPGQHRAQQGDARVAHRLLAPAAHGQEVDAQHQRDGQEHDQGERPFEGHQTTLPNHRTESSAPMSISTAPPAANRPETSVCSETSLKRRSIDLEISDRPAASSASW